jgi:hypothetical protein
MSFFPKSLENLIDKFAALPGVGRKSAQRLAFHVLSLPEGEAEAFAAAIVDARKRASTAVLSARTSPRARSAPSAPATGGTRAPSAWCRSPGMCGHGAFQGV